MDRIELTISKNYVKDWGLVEGVRELIQNGMDAKVDGDTFAIRFDRGKKQLEVENIGTRLSRKTLLLGNTSKADRKDQIGQFGEGYKLGVMAIVRAGRKVEMITGFEIWHPVIALSENFDDEEVLCFDVEYDLNEFNGVSVVVSPFDQDDWNAVTAIILPEKRHSFKCIHGELLLEEKYFGKVFVGGLLVSGIDGLKFGYNLSPRCVTVDRDRKMVSQFSVLYEAKYILEEYAKGDGLKKVANLLSSGAMDVAHFKNSIFTKTEFTRLAVADFIETHGEDSFPVRNDDERKQALFVGKKPVYVSEEYASVLSPEVGRIHDIAAAFSRSVVKEFSLSDLTDNEIKNFERCVMLLNRAGHDTRCISIVEFTDDRLYGFYNNGTIKISRTRASDWRCLLETMIHELAHASGSDGCKYHVDKLEDIWTSVISEVWDLFNSHDMTNVVVESDDVIEVRL